MISARRDVVYSVLVGRGLIGIENVVVNLKLKMKTKLKLKTAERN